MRKPSDEFWAAFRCGGSLVILCEHCGRTHFCTTSGAVDYNEGELEELLEKAKKDPDMYREDGTYSSIEWGYIGGKQSVMHCPCNEEKIAPYEQFIIVHAEQILEYLQSRANKKLRSSQSLMDKVNETLNATEEADNASNRSPE
ncbi:hypothetical protein LCGC14_0164510 [marine sediment metagenome]|uniref:Uncharacterized protein n=1 Tax=marine sediment metagenome TaxID=412755 RepID=A0A0F9VAN9_9ZZZZ